MNLKNLNVTKKILGYPATTEDIVKKRVIWQKTQTINDDHKTGIRNDFNRSTIQSNIDFDYTERVYDVHFYSVIDILSKLGGLRASILPIL